MTDTYDHIQNLEKRKESEGWKVVKQSLSPHRGTRTWSQLDLQGPTRRLLAATIEYGLSLLNMSQVSIALTYSSFKVGRGSNTKVP